jgi:DNA-binding response OmpR family regulator
MAKILVIDDEPSIVNLVAAYLKPEGYEVLTAMDGTDGLKAARAFKPDLIILDIMLPGIDGIELLSRLQRESNVYVNFAHSENRRNRQDCGAVYWGR